MMACRAPGVQVVGELRWQQLVGAPGHIGEGRCGSLPQGDARAAPVPLQQCHGAYPTNYNVLDDSQLPQGIKHYSNQPTSPQVYLNCKFMAGGGDILLQMHLNWGTCRRTEKAGDLLCPIRWNRRPGLRVRVTEPGATGIRITLPEKPYQFWFSLFR